MNKYTELLGITAAIVFSGCSENIKEFKADSAPVRVFTTSSNQTAPQPAYGRLRWVMPPDPLPERGLPESTGSRVNPVFHLALKDTTLDEAMLALANGGRYTSHCPGSVCRSVKVNVNALGTIDELSQAVSKAAGYQITVDHSAKELRLGERMIRASSVANPPEFFGKKHSGASKAQTHKGS